MVATEVRPGYSRAPGYHGSPTGYYLDEVQVASNLCKRSFSHFCQEFWEEIHPDEKLIWGWHNDYMCRTKQRAAERVFLGLPKLYDLIFNVPPGTTKSTVESIMFPAWTWVRMPSARHICASHTEQLVHDLARYSRDVVQSPKYQEYFPGITLREDQRTKGYYMNSRGGFRLSVTVGGKTPTGFHSHFLSVDDAIDPKKAISLSEVKTANYFMTNVLSTRKVSRDVSLTTLVMQRLSQDDPSGNWLRRAMSEPDVRIKHVCLPAELTPNVKPAALRKKYIGGLLDPIRLSRRALAEEKAKGNFLYSGQFLQDPIPEGGLMFDTRQLILGQLPPPDNKFKRIIRGWDNSCLVAGTLIETQEGQKPIQYVREGDYVLTRKGFKRVRWAGQSGEASQLVSILFNNGSIVTGTPEHLIWCQVNGWIPLAALEGQSWLDQNHTSQVPSIFGLMESSFRGSRGRDIIGRRGAKMENSGASRCIGRYGNSTEETFPKAIMYITRTTTGMIIRLRGWNCSLQKNIPLDMPTNGLGQKEIKKLWQKIARRELLVTENGVPVTRVSRGSERLANGFTKTFLRKEECVNSVRKDSYSKPFRGEVNFVANHVLINIDTNVLNIGENQPVNFVGEDFLDGQGLNCVRNRVLGNGIGRLGGKKIPVYDIEVEDCHEFYANGILVHNSNTGDGDYTTGVKIGLTRDDPPRVWILHVHRGQWNTNMRERQKDKMAEFDGRGVEIAQEQEPGSGGKDTATMTTIRLGLMGFKVITTKPTGDKELRADPFSVQVNAGNVYLAPGGWNHDYIEELKYFPHGMYDDQVDGTSVGYNELAKPRKRVGCF